MRIDLFSMYVLLSHFRPRDGVPENSFFKNVVLCTCMYLHNLRKDRLQNSRFFLKISKESVKRGVRVLRARSARASHARSVSSQSHSPFSASFQTFCLTARAYLNTQKYGLFCSLMKRQRVKSFENSTWFELENKI